ncbi:MAG: TolC family protein [Firmicutes bacterium]|nr:TolC family protein [Bacillota bacterium]
MRLKILLILFALVLIFSGTATAWQQSVLSLEEALQAVLEQKIEVKEAENTLLDAKSDFAAFEEEQGLQWELSLPAATFDADGLQLSETWALTGKAGSTTEYTINLGKRAAGIPSTLKEELSFSVSRRLWPDPEPALDQREESLVMGVQFAEKSLADTQNQVLISAYDQYRNLQLGQIKLKLLEEKAALAQSTYQKAKRLLEIDETTPAEVKEAEAAWLRQEATLVKERAAWQKEKVVFLQSLGRAANIGLDALNLTEVIEQAEACLAEPDQPAVSLETVLAESREIQTLAGQVRLKEKALEIAEGDSAWAVDLSVGVTTDIQTQETDWSAGLSATLDLSGQKARERQVEKAHRELELAKQKLAEARVRVEQEFSQARADLTYQKALLEAAYFEWQAAEGNLQVAAKQLREGFITDDQYSETKIAAKTAQLQLAQAYFAYRVQHLKLLSLAGEKPLLEIAKGETSHAD